MFVVKVFVFLFVGFEEVGEYWMSLLFEDICVMNRM